MKRLNDRKKKFIPGFKVSKKQLVLISVPIITLILFSAYITGNASSFIPVKPFASIGENRVELNCKYRDVNETIVVVTHSNISNYYRNLSQKRNAIADGDFSQLVYVNSTDTTIRDIAEEIREIGSKRNLNSDQLVELASCFVQNIPYDDYKAEIVLTDKRGNSSDTEQFPYETIHKNSGICTDKTYLGSAIIQELGYGTGIMLFPDAEHMALGIKAPTGHTDFGTKYMYAEMTTSNFTLGELPSEVSETNGRPAVSINTVSDIKIEDNPSDISFYTGNYISSPNLVIDVNDGKEYQRIVEIDNLENSIISEYEELMLLDETIDASYNELISRERYMNSTYSVYLGTPDTSLDCGYKYNYNYSYYYNYDYSSQYEYRCDTVTNPAKNRSYNTYSHAYDSYNNQIDHYNNLLNEYNIKADAISVKVDKYKTYSY